MTSRFRVPLFALVLIATAPYSPAQSDPNYVMTIVAPPFMTPGETFTTDVVLDIQITGGAVFGWGYGVCIDEAVLSIPGPHPPAPPSFPTSNPDNADTATVQGGAAAAFESLVVLPGGYIHGVVIGLFGNDSLPPGTTGFVMTSCDYSVDPEASGPTTIALCGTLGEPIPYETVVAVAGVAILPVLNPAVVDTVGPQFRRADANLDGEVDIADGVWIVNDLFHGGPTTGGVGGCDAANDANGDGTVDIADPMFIFGSEFLGGPEPPAPYPDCGSTPSQLPAPSDCDDYPAC